MATIKISQFPTMSASDADSANDVLPIVDTNLGTNKKITLDNLGSSITASHAIFAITASHALNGGGGGGGGVGTLQQVMTSGSSTTIAITGSYISASEGFIGEYFAKDLPGVGVNSISMRVNNRIDILPNNSTALRLSDSEVISNKNTRVNGHITASGTISASGDLYVRDGRFTRGTAEVEIIGSTSDGVIGTQTNHNLLIRRNNVEKLRLEETKTHSSVSAIITGSLIVSGSQINVTEDGTISTDNTVSTKNLFSSGSVKRKVREVTLTAANSTGTGMPAIQADDDIILVVGNTAGTPGVNDYTLNCYNMFYGNTSEIGRTVTIVNASSAVGADLKLGSPTPGGDYTANGVTTTGAFGAVCGSLGDEVTIIIRANNSVIIYGSGI